MPSRKPGKITFKGKIDSRLIPTDAAPGYEIVDAKVTETAVEVLAFRWQSHYHSPFVVSNFGSCRSKTAQGIRELGSWTSTGSKLERPSKAEIGLNEVVAIAPIGMINQVVTSFSEYP